MNDFHATIVDWDAFLSGFGSDQLNAKLGAALESGDHEEASVVAQEFLYRFMWLPGEEDEVVALRFYRLGEVASHYPKIRQLLDAEAISRLDALYVPFVGQWMTLDPPQKPVLDLPREMRLLGYGGLSVALDPLHCQKIADGLAPWPTWLERGSSAVPAESFGVMVQETQQLANLVSAAVSSRKGVLVVFEI